MGVFGYLFGQDEREDMPELLPAIERAVSGVEPLLKQISGYPNSYRKPVAIALEYAHSLADSMPGPGGGQSGVIRQGCLCSRAVSGCGFRYGGALLQRGFAGLSARFPASDELYALMGMRRHEKTVVGMELSGQTIQRDVVQKAVYFTNHTIENPAPSERQARDQVAWSFFDSLVGKVKKRVGLRKQAKQSQLQERDMLMARLRTANAQKN